MPLAARLATRSLSLPQDIVPSFEGDLRYPTWLAGTWRVTNKAVGFTMPMGKRFVDPFLVTIAQQDLSAAKELTYTLRFNDQEQPPAAQPTLTVRQDRPFNTIAEERAFSASRGATVERGSYDCDAAHPHGRVLMAVRDDEPSGVRGVERPPEGIAWEVRRVVRSQLELDIAWQRWEETTTTASRGGAIGGGVGGGDGGGGGGGGRFVTSELAVQRASLPSPSSQMIDESFLEILTSFEQPAAADQPVRARYRVAQYLSLPGVPPPKVTTPEARKLAKQAGFHAIALLDYEMTMERA